MRWIIYILVALVVALVPCVIFPELIIPFDHWAAWEWARSGRRVEYSGANYPPALRVEMPIFTAIVLPPQWLAERFGYHRTMYGDLAFSHADLNAPGSSFHYTPPPIIAAGEHLLVALPFWLAVVVTACELSRLGLNRRKRPARTTA
jgi:hypothetical protein